MKLRHLAFLAAGPVALAGATPVSAPAGPVSARSVYQLDGPWTDDGGGSFRLADLRGHPVVLAMIFTRCGYACPLTVQQMKGLEEALPGPLRRRTRFVLVSFDAEGDTPAVLHAYRERFGLDSGWVLLHGDPGQIRDLAMVLGVSYSQAGPGFFIHSSLVSVLNAEGEIVGQRPSLLGATAETVRLLATAR